MGFYSSWNEPIKISKPVLSSIVLILSIFAHIVCSYASEKSSDEHTHLTEYTLEDCLRFNTMVSSTTSASSVTPLFLFNADGSTQILNS